MSAVLHLFGFDFRRCWKLLCLWWVACAVFLILGLGLIYGSEYPKNDAGYQLFVMILYGLGALFVGIVMQPYRTGRLHSFFNARAVFAKELVKGRLLLIGVCVLLPFYLAQLVLFLLVHPRWIEALALSLFFWALSIAVVLLLSYVAGLSKSLPSYLVRSILTWILLVIPGSLSFSNYGYSKPGIFFVEYPEAVSLLWKSGLCSVCAVLLYVSVRRVYLGRVRWYSLTVTFVLIFVCAFLFLKLLFRPSPTAGLKPVDVAEIDLDVLSYKVIGHQNGFRVQRNRNRGYSTYGQHKPPYVDSIGEEYWFVRGNLTVDGLDPKLNYSAKLVNAQWTAESGEVLDYVPPMGTELVTDAFHTPIPALVTDACLDDLLGVAPAVDERGIQAGGDVVLFGAWTSDYARFKNMPGELKLQVRVDFYTHAIRHELSLVNASREVTPEGRLLMTGVNQRPQELEVELVECYTLPQVKVAMEDRWQGGRDWVLFDTESLKRSKAAGHGSGGMSWANLNIRRQTFDFRSDFHSEHAPDFGKLESLKLVRIQPVYLGSEIVDVTVEDFALVSERALNLK